MSGAEPPRRDLIDADGFAIASGIIGPTMVNGLRRDVDRLLNEGGRHGARNIFARSQSLRDLARHPLVASIARSVLGASAFAVRGLIFDKQAAANWMVGWHQDLTIAVAVRQESAGYTAWTAKEGIPHVQPPTEILQGMLAVRLHLDAAGEDNGALMVLPGSHRKGRLTKADMDGLVRKTVPVTCAADAGDILVMRPLLVHASHRSRSDGRRRVVHLEFSSRDLPAPLRWFEELR